MTTPTAQVLAEAAAKRHIIPGAGPSDAQLRQEHEKRQHFRRLIDPGIMRPNSKQVALDSLKTLSTMAENILREPDNPKYQTFKRENEMIQRRLVRPKGALEYAIELGFRPKVIEHQSYYVFDAAVPSRMADLHVGAAILHDALEREIDKEARAQQNVKAQKAAAAMAAENVKLAFLDDRKNKMMRDQREREAREAAGRSQVAVSVALAPSSPPGPMPGQGHALVGETVNHDDTVDSDRPPPYH